MTSPALGPLDGRVRLLGVKDNYEYTVLEGAACRYKPFVVMGLFLWRGRVRLTTWGCTGLD